ncbi:MAG: DEAD/DEAH box helicase [Alsobacter sp.]
MTDFKLRDYQGAALDEVFWSWTMGEADRILLQAPTGSGKTAIGAEIAARWVARDLHHRWPTTSVVIACPALALIPQWIAALQRIGLGRQIGVMQADHPLTRPKAQIQIAMIQTLAARGMPRGVGLLIADEAHVEFRVVTEWVEGGNGLVVGLTATPWTRTRRLFGRHLIVTTSKELTRKGGYLARALYYAPATIDTSSVRKDRGDFAPGQLEAVARTQENVRHVVNAYWRRSGGVPTLIFAVSIPHAQAIRDALNEADITTDLITGDTSRDDREASFASFRSGKVDALVSVAAMTTGVDLPEASCLIVARPTWSETLWVQMVGRGLRTAPGKTRCVVVDLGGNVARLGYPWEIEIAERDQDGRRAPSAPRSPVVDCDGCSLLIPSRLLRCPECGRECHPRDRGSSRKAVLGSGW